MPTALISAKAMRVIGVAMCVLAAIIGILNLQRVAALGANLLPPVLLVLGAALIALSKKRNLKS